MPWFLPMLGKALLGGVVSAVAARAMRPKQTIEHRTTIQKTESKADLSAMVADSQKAGINPLTALRSGMGTAYGTNVTRTILPPLASPTFLQSALGGAISGFGNFLTNMPTPYEREMRGLRMQELKGNIAYTGALARQTLLDIKNATIPFKPAFPTVPDNVFETDVVPLSKQAIVDVANIAINSSGQAVQSKTNPFNTSRVLPDGTMLYAPEMDDLDSFLLQSTIVGGYMFKEGVKGIFTGKLNKNPALNPNLPVVYPLGMGPDGPKNAWGVKNTAKEVGNPFPWLGRTLMDQ